MCDFVFPRVLALHTGSFLTLAMPVVRQGSRNQLGCFASSPPPPELSRYGSCLGISMVFSHMHSLLTDEGSCLPIFRAGSGTRTAPMAAARGRDSGFLAQHCFNSFATGPASLRLRHTILLELWCNGQRVPPRLPGCSRRSGLQSRRRRTR